MGLPGGRVNLEGMEWKGKEVERTNCFGGGLRRAYDCDWKWRHLEGLRCEVYCVVLLGLKSNFFGVSCGVKEKIDLKVSRLRRRRWQKRKSLFDFELGNRKPKLQ